MQNKNKLEFALTFKSCITFIVLCLAFGSTLIYAVETNAEKTDSEESRKGPFVENSLFSFRLIPRSPEQMAAFYEARGFPKSAIDLISKTCYFTAIIRNKSKRVIWLDLKYWRFYNDQDEITRIDRQYWNKHWDQIKLPQAYRSTFGWTLLPEIRNLQPNENVGGNIVLPSLGENFTLEAMFITGKNKRGGEIRAELKNISCQKDENPQS